MSITMKAEKRDGTTKSELNELRRNGKIPGVVYGKDMTSTPIAVDEKQLLALLRDHPHSIVEMELPDADNKPVLIHSVQKDKLYRNLLHVDFHQISMNEKVRTSISLELVGEPKGVKEGGMLQVLRHEIEVRCLPDRLVESLEVDLSGLGLGDHFTVGDVSVPEGIEVKSDADDIIATVLVPQRVAESEEEKEAQQENPQAAKHENQNEKTTEAVHGD